MAGNPTNLKKIVGSKWTAARPSGREKHFLVTGWARQPDGSVSTELLELEAVLTTRVRTIHWRELSDPERWRIGWR